MNTNADRRVSVSFAALIPLAAAGVIAALPARAHGDPQLTAVGFSTATGYRPNGGLVIDSAGGLYGTVLDYNVGGGTLGVFSCSFARATNTFLVAIVPPSEFSTIAPLMLDSTGNLYGTSISGGANGFGGVFRVATVTNQATMVGSFDQANSYGSSAAPVMDTAGNIYGTIYGSPVPSEKGSVFKLAAGSNTVTNLVVFNGPNGAQPFARLYLDSAGNLYGTTVTGGASNLGTVFRIDAGTSNLVTLVTFNGPNGSNPQSDLIADASGNLYGTTSSGGASDQGTVFRIDAGSNTLTTLASFNGANGSGPRGGVIADAAGNLFGCAVQGGVNNAGTVYKVAAGTNQLSVVVYMQTSIGTRPRSSLVADSAGNLYGVATSGGPHSAVGSVFKVAGSGFVTPGDPCRADINLDGTINTLDLLQMLFRFGQPCP